MPPRGVKRGSEPDAAPGTVAVLGAGGTMGRGIAANLAAAGIPVRAWNRSAEKIEDLAARSERVSAHATAAEATAGAGFVLTILSDAEATLETVDGADGALAAAETGAVWIQMGTIGVEGGERAAELAARHGLAFVDAPVLGTRKPAEEGQLVVLASGPEDRRKALEPVFAALGKRTLWVGEAGAGSRLKVVVNAWIVSVLEGAAEAIALAEAVGVDPELFLEAVADGPLDLPYLQMKGRAMIAREFSPVSFRLALAAKDAGLAVDAAAAEGLEVPMLEAIRDRMVEAAGEHGEEDMAAVFLAGTPV